jgi:hypothetical protein
MIAGDGIVIAADTKEGYGETHTYVDKITMATSNACKAAIASSGESYLLDYMTPPIKKILEDEECTDAGIFLHRLRSLMVSLYESEEIKAYPKETASDLYTQFLVGVKFINDMSAKLFVVNSTLVAEAVQLGTVIGCGPLRQVGEELANATAFRIPRAKYAAMAVVHEAKRRYSDVGGKTSIVSITNNNEFDFEDEGVCSEKEELLDRLRYQSNLLTLSVLDSSVATSHFNTVLNRICGQLKDMHRKAKEIDSRHARELQRGRKRAVARVVGRKKQRKTQGGS